MSALSNATTNEKVTIFADGTEMFELRRNIVIINCI